MRPSARIGIGGAVIGLLLGAASIAGAQVHRDSRFAVGGNVFWQTTANTRTDRVDFRIYEEDGQFAVTQRIPRAPVYDAGIETRVWKGFGVGASVAYTNIVARGTITAEVPHPFFFDFPRMATGETGGLLHREWALHLRGQYWLHLGSRVRLTMFAGPSLYDVRQELVAETAVTEIGFPFNDVGISETRTETVNLTAVGFNAGVDVAYFGLRQLRIFGSSAALDRLALTGTLRYNRAAPAIGFQGQFQPALELGGTQVGGGLRVVF